MKKILVILAVVLSFLLPLCAYAQCERPWGVNVLTSRTNAEKKMIEEFGAPEFKDKDTTMWKQNSGALIYFNFTNDKFISAMFIVTKPATKENAVELLSFAKQMEKGVPSNYRFADETTNKTDNGIEIRSRNYICNDNPKHMIAISISKDPKRGLIAVDGFSFYNATKNELN